MIIIIISPLCYTIICKFITWLRASVGDKYAKRKADGLFGQKYYSLAAFQDRAAASWKHVIFSQKNQDSVCVLPLSEGPCIILVFFCMESSWPSVLKGLPSLKQFVNPSHSFTCVLVALFDGFSFFPGEDAFRNFISLENGVLACTC